MPRTVDLATRKEEITAAALHLLATDGPRALTLRALAKQLGGSSTLVTHFYPNRNELLKAITAQIIQQYDNELAELDEIVDPVEGLRALLEWLLPIDPIDRGLARRRVMMSAEADSNVHLQHYFSSMEQKERDVLRRRISPLVPSSEVETYVDVLRSFTNGIVLSAVEHPDRWPQERQIVALDLVVDSLGLSGESQPTSKVKSSES